MDNNTQIISSSQENTRVSAASFGAKYASKREVYRFLTSEVGVYLSSYETMTVYHMRDLVSGKRRIIKAKEV